MRKDENYYMECLPSLADLKNDIAELKEQLANIQKIWDNLPELIKQHYEEVRIPRIKAMIGRTQFVIDMAVKGYLIGKDKTGNYDGEAYNQEAMERVVKAIFGNIDSSLKSWVSVRAFNLLSRNNIKTVRDLLELSVGLSDEEYKERLLSIRGMGRKTVKEVMERTNKLKRYFKNDFVTEINDKYYYNQDLLDKKLEEEYDETDEAYYE